MIRTEKYCFKDCRKLMFEYDMNNPAPLKKKGKCCGICNIEKVMPARFLLRIIPSNKKNKRTNSSSTSS